MIFHAPLALLAGLFALVWALELPVAEADPLAPIMTPDAPIALAAAN